MKKFGSVKALEELGRQRLSQSFFLRDFLHSEIASFYGLSNVPDDPELAVAAGAKLCQELLEPLQMRFGRIAIRSAYRSCEVNELGNRKGHNCARNEANYANHIWDRRDAGGFMGATACIVIPYLVDRMEKGSCTWQAMAWWIHDNLPYSRLQFFPKLAAFNIQWHEKPLRRIESFIEPRGLLTKEGMSNWIGDHSDLYRSVLD
ncbi:hypothetical protein [Limibacillus halophilus]|uniref:Peptidase M15 n=1 Tax=Limibacillus halophilus TaxID=1579333 RepID=A0A839SVE5_9PROT|nr:hypothetical protein [Limibacillus halophilus]MBB3065999.1 hypothetical protein [Limibacillus halophilus]